MDRRLNSHERSGAPRTLPWEAIAAGVLGAFMVASAVWSSRELAAYAVRSASTGEPAPLWIEAIFQLARPFVWLLGGSTSGGNPRVNAQAIQCVQILWALVGLALLAAAAVAWHAGRSKNSGSGPRAIR